MNQDVGALEFIFENCNFFLTTICEKAAIISNLNNQIFKFGFSFQEGMGTNSLYDTLLIKVPTSLCKI